MAASAMHGDEITTTVSQVRELVAQQFPEFAGLPVEAVVSAGTDNAMYRLGDALAVRVPRAPWSVGMVNKEQEWVPFLAPQLPLSIPQPVAFGTASDAFAYPWSIVEWLPGELASLDHLADPIDGARTLGRFVKELQGIDAKNGPTHGRGAPVRNSDAEVRQGIAGLEGEVDPLATERAWQRVLDVPDYSGPPVWFHGDLGPLNLLANNGQLTSVIDWGTCGVGDPAVDARVAWSLFDSDARNAYRATVGFNEETWERGKGWVLSGVSGIPYYRRTNPELVETLLKGIRAVLDEQT